MVLTLYLLLLLLLEVAAEVGVMLGAQTVLAVWLAVLAAERGIIIRVLVLLYGLVVLAQAVKGMQVVAELMLLI